MRNGECGMDRASVEPTANPGDRTLPAIPQSAFRTPHSGVGWCGEAQAAAGPARDLGGRGGVSAPGGGGAAGPLCPRDRERTHLNTPHHLLSHFAFFV